MGLVGQAPRTRQVPQIPRHESERQRLGRDQLVRADPPGDGERLLVALLGCREVAGVQEHRADAVERARLRGLVDGLPEQALGLVKGGDRLLRPAHGVQSVTLEEESFGQDLGLPQLPDLVAGGLRRPQLFLGMSLPARDLRGREVDPGVFPQGEGELAQRGQRGHRLGAAARGREVAGEAQPILQVVRIERPQGAVHLARLAPVLPGLGEAGLDGQPILFRQRVRELDRPLRLLAGLGVVPQLGPGRGERGTDHRRFRIGLRGLAQEVERTLGVEGAQLDQPFDVEAGRLRVGRQQRLRGLRLLR